MCGERFGIRALMLYLDVQCDGFVGALRAAQRGTSFVCLSDFVKFNTVAFEVSVNRPCGWSRLIVFISDNCRRRL